MNIFQKYLAASTLGLGLAMAPQVHAALSIDIGNDGIIEASDLNNVFASYSSGAVTFNGFNINTVSIAGIGSFGGSGELADTGSLNISSVGVGTLVIKLVETDLNVGAGGILSGEFSGTLSGVTVHREWFLDTTNQGLAATSIGYTDSAAGTFSYSSAPAGLYSLTELITVTANAPGAKLSSDDTIKVPEPTSLALVGLALAGLGVASRRRKA